MAGLTELWMARERVGGKIQSGVKPPQSKKSGSGLNFWKMITFAPSLEIPSSMPDDRLLFQILFFKFQVSAFSSAPKPSTLDFRLSAQSPYLRDLPTA
jgi:hypothetical protein